MEKETGEVEAVVESGDGVCEGYREQMTYTKKRGGGEKRRDEKRGSD